MDQQQIIQIQMMEQEVNQLNQQLQLIEQNIAEMGELMASLDEIGINKEIMANLGKRIYIPVEIKEDKLIVDVGKENFVKKSISETKEIVERETGKLMEGKGQIMERLEGLQNEMNGMIMNMQKEQMKSAGKEKEGSIERMVGSSSEDDEGHEGK